MKFLDKKYRTNLLIQIFKFIKLNIKILKAVDRTKRI